MFCILRSVCQSRRENLDAVKIWYKIAPALGQRVFFVRSWHLFAI